MKNIYKPPMPVFAIIVMIFSSCSGVFVGSFQGTQPVKNSDGNYVELVNGTIIRGEKIKWGRLFSHVVTIDDQKIKEYEVKGLQENGIYRIRTSRGFLERVVNGKVSVVKKNETHISGGVAKGHTTSISYTDTYYYIILPEDLRMILIKKNEDIKKVIASCPTALAMMDISNKQLKRAIKQNPAYLNEVFAIYNNECKPLEEKKRVGW